MALAGVSRHSYFSKNSHSFAWSLAVRDLLTHELTTASVVSINFFEKLAIDHLCRKDDSFVP